MATVKIKGLKRLQKSLKDNATLSDVKTVVKQNGIEMQAKWYVMPCLTEATLQVLLSEVSEASQSMVALPTRQDLEHITVHMSSTVRVL